MANWPMTKQQTMPSHYLADLDVEKQLISFKITGQHFLRLIDFLTSTDLQLSDFFIFLRMWTTFTTLDFSYFSQDVDYFYHFGLFYISQDVDNHQLSSSPPHFD